MKKIKIPLEDLIAVLEAMRESAGTQEIIIFEQDGLPALADAEEPENVIMFQPADPEDGDTESAEGTMH